MFSVLLIKKNQPNNKPKPQKSTNKKSTKNTVFHGRSEPYLFITYGERHLVKKVFSVFLVHQGKHWSNWIELSSSKIYGSSKEAPKTVMARLIWNLFPFQKVYGLGEQGLLKLPLGVAVVQKFASNKGSDKGETCMVNQSQFVIR